MGYPLYEKVNVSYEYDFAVDGGAIGDIVLRKSGANGLDANQVIVGAKLVIETDLASGTGDATIGDGTDPDGFYLDLVAAGSGSYSHLSDLGGALLKETQALTDESDNVIEQERGVKLSTAINPELVVGTGALTAGKFKLVFDVIQFA